MSTAEKLNPAVQIKLTVLKGPHQGQSFLLSKSSFTIGRGPENEVVLINDPQISRQHARLQVVDHDIEIINLSQKNKVMVGSEIVQRWKLVNDSIFVIGNTEIKIIYDLGKPSTPQVVRNNVAQPPPPPVVSLAPAPVAKQSVVKKASSPPPVAKRNMVNPAPQPPRPAAFIHPAMPTQTWNSSGGGSKELLANPKARFYLILGIIVLGLVYWLNMEEPNQQKQEVKSTLRYEDEYLIKQNSVAEKELDQRRKSQLAQKNSPTALRIDENFQKGMRDYQLGNYIRALDFFQVVLNLDPTHVLARRHFFLAQIRFDEIVKTKLALGESYYQKHNFKMCQAMYQQVLIMLQGKNNDQSYQIAQSMSDKCALAAEGIR